ncbi:putative S-crystallin 3 [Hypsibius exemplaris]|uniref:S-crystallin 3 n=1 Tax=Hypsibius exemplaris TaxID=2072580 RepID=A0A1W0XCK0_HYPEX|nr:putative S-crystallin 3 [Hypsibius exemplaris]
MSRIVSSQGPKTAPKPNLVTAAPSFRLYYFNIKARGEVIRLIFHAVGAKFDDVRVEDSTGWAKLKTDMPLRTLPTLEFDGMQLGQTMSIARYLALEFGLRGQGVYEQALVDSAAETADDLLSDFLEVVFIDRNSKKAEAKRNFVEHILPQTLQQLDRYQKQHSSEYGYIVGNGLTFADLAVYNVLDQILTSGMIELGYYQRFRYPTELRKRIMTHGGLMRYLNNRPRTKI